MIAVMSAPSQGSRGLSLYDNLLDPNDPPAPATISSAPVLYDQSASSSGDPAAPKKPIDPAFRFQPIRRPPVKQPKPKIAAFPKTIPKPAAPTATRSTATESTTSAPTTNPSLQTTLKSTLADWAATEEDEWMYGVGEKRQRGGRKKKKKKHQEQFDTDWDELYDPTRPTNVDEYLRSDEKVDEVREWKALLYRHRKRRDESDVSDEEESRPPPNQFAPPPSYAFAPPPRSPPAATSKDETAGDAYARRLAMSAQQPPILSPPPQHPPSPPPQIQAPPPPPPSPPPPPPPGPSDSTTISRAPIRYTQPEEPARTDDDDDLDEDDAAQPAPRSNRPGQAGFAHRLMTKYGWTQGTALGATESGILNPLRVQVDKRRKKADAEGGGWAEPGGKGRIIGGKRKEHAGSFGSMSEVIVLGNMLENMPDLQAEIADGLGQEIGEECGEKYGRVERLYIDQATRRVFIKFTDQVSALRAVNELDGRGFNGNTIAPRFYDAESFEKGDYGSAD